jgi:hypothetical protein
VCSRGSRHCVVSRIHISVSKKYFASIFRTVKTYTGVRMSKIKPVNALDDLYGYEDPYDSVYFGRWLVTVLPKSDSSPIKRLGVKQASVDTAMNCICMESVHYRWPVNCDIAPLQISIICRLTN